MSEVKLSPGSLFSIPLLNGTFALGVMLQFANSKTALLASFLNFRITDRFDLRSTSWISSDLVFMSAVCSILDFSTKRWRLISELEGFDRDEWPFPIFYRVSNHFQKHQLIFYDDNLTDIKKMEWVDDLPANALPDTVMGGGYLEKTLELANLALRIH